MSRDRIELDPTGSNRIYLYFLYSILVHHWDTIPPTPWHSLFLDEVAPAGLGLGLGLGLELGLWLGLGLGLGSVSLNFPFPLPLPLPKSRFELVRILIIWSRGECPIQGSLARPGIRLILPLYLVVGVGGFLRTQVTVPFYFHTVRSPLLPQCSSTPSVAHIYTGGSVAFNCLYTGQVFLHPLLS